MIDRLRGDDTGRDRQNALWVQLSRSRSALDPARAKRSDGSVIVTRPPGFVLDSERIASSRSPVDVWLPPVTFMQPGPLVIR